MVVFKICYVCVYRDINVLFKWIHTLYAKSLRNFWLKVYLRYIYIGTCLRMISKSKERDMKKKYFFLFTADNLFILRIK